MKNLLIYFIILFIHNKIIAQKKNDFNFDMNLGYYLTNSNGLAFELNHELKYYILKNLSIGLRCGGSFSDKKIILLNNNSDNSKNELLEFNFSFLGTLEYCYYKKNKFIHPFFGIGFGRFRLTELGIYGAPQTVHIKEGFYYRIGFKIKKYQFAINAYKIPNTYKSGNNQNIGYIKNDYISFSVGYTIKNVFRKRKKRSNREK